MFFNPDFSVIDAAIVKDPKLGDLIMIVKNENSNPPEKNLRVTRTKKIEKGFPTKVSAPITCLLYTSADVFCFYVGHIDIFDRSSAVHGTL